MMPGARVTALDVGLYVKPVVAELGVIVNVALVQVELSLFLIVTEKFEALPRPIVALVGVTVMVGLLRTQGGGGGGGGTPSKRMSTTAFSSVQDRTWIPKPG